MAYSRLKTATFGYIDICTCAHVLPVHYPGKVIEKWLIEIGFLKKT